MKPRFWKIAAITQAVVLLALIRVVVWFYPVFRGARHHFLDRACAFGGDIGDEILLGLGADPDGQRDRRQYQEHIAHIEPTLPLFHATWQTFRAARQKMLSDLGASGGSWMDANDGGLGAVARIRNARV
jgi:hypothetical protein